MLTTLLRKPVRIDLSESTPDSQSVRSSGLNHEQLVDRIIALNPSASPVFLARFDELALEQYLNHLSLAAAPRGRETRWIRPNGQTWAVASRACA